jgi:hypothetical protein
MDILKFRMRLPDEVSGLWYPHTFKELCEMNESAIASKLAADDEARAALEQARKLNDGLTEKYQNLVKLMDQQFGTPCEEIRHAQEIEQARARIAVLEKALGAWIDKMDVIHESGDYKGVWSFYYAHSMTYRGPTYEIELRNARAALTPLNKGDHP